MEPDLLLRRLHLTKQEGDHALPLRAMALRGPPRRPAGPINRLMVKGGKSRMPPRFE